MRILDCITEHAEMKAVSTANTVSETSDIWFCGGVHVLACSLP